MEEMVSRREYPTSRLFLVLAVIAWLVVSYSAFTALVNARSGLQVWPSVAYAAMLVITGLLAWKDRQFLVLPASFVMLVTIAFMLS